MAEEGIGEVRETKVNLDRFFPTGYVIGLGKGQYFKARQKQRILVTKQPSLAWYFSSAEAAERFARRKLGFVGMDIQICLFAWVLISWEGMKEIYWQGEDYTAEEKEAMRFSSYYIAKKYQKENALQRSGMIELHRFHEKQFQLTAA